MKTIVKIYNHSDSWMNSREHTIAGITAYHLAHGLPVPSREEINEVFDRCWEEARNSPNIEYHEEDDDLIEQEVEDDSEKS